MIAMGCNNKKTLYFAIIITALVLIISIIGIYMLLGVWFPGIGLIDGLLTFGMSIVTLTFLITTPKYMFKKMLLCWPGGCLAPPIALKEL